MVNLTTGLWTIDKSLVIHSHTYLFGQGSALSTLSGASGLNAPLIINSDASLNNISIASLTLRCGLVDREMHFPAYCHTAPNSSCDGGRFDLFGILLMDLVNVPQGTGLVGVTVGPDLEITTCAMGMHCKGVTDLSVARVEFHNNGAIETYWHNLYFRRVTGGRVAHSLFHSSSTGNGVNVDVSSNVTLFNNTAHSNFFRGLRVENSVGMTLSSNLAHGNGQYGFRLASSSDCVFQNNRASNNALKDCYIAGNTDLIAPDLDAQCPTRTLPSHSS